MRHALLAALLPSLSAQDPTPPAVTPAAAERTLPDALILGACFPAPRLGIVVGGRGETDPAVVMRSEDDGATWQAARIPSPTARLYDVQFPTPLVGFACGLNGMLLRTAEAGRVWDAVPTPFERAWFTAVHFLDGERGFLTGRKDSPLLAGTKDGGKTWERVSIPGDAVDGDLRDVQFVGSLGLACGSNGLLLRTEDAGASWQQVPTGTKAWLRHLCLVDEQVGFLVSGDGDLMATSDGGKTWQTRGRFGGKGNGVAFADRNRGLVTTMQGVLFRTGNGGESFVVEQQGRAALTDVVSLGKDGFWVFGERGQAIRLPAGICDR